MMGSFSPTKPSDVRERPNNGRASDRAWFAGETKVSLRPGPVATDFRSPGLGYALVRPAARGSAPEPTDSYEVRDDDRKRSGCVRRHRARCQLDRAGLS